MTRTNRIEEILKTMKSFSKPKYQKTELLDEMFALQREMVELTFNGEHASTADLKIWDVEKHFEQLNQNCGNVADDELQVFKNESKTFCNLIKAEISGIKGETKAFRTLQSIHGRNIILKNIELGDGEARTELDAVVILPETVAIIEVKNTARDIFIDEKGDYYRTGEFLKWDCNIAEKMRLKEDLLRKALFDRGINDTKIRSIVVFTDSRIEVQNQYSCIRTCFVSQLPYILNGFRGAKVMTEEEMNQTENAIREAECKEAYPFDFDVKQYKNDFATLMAILEDASAKEENAIQDETVKTAPEIKKPNPVLRSKLLGYAGSAAAAAVITLISTMVIETIRKGGILR